MDERQSPSFSLRLLNNAIKRQAHLMAPPPFCECATHLHGMIIGYLAENPQRSLFQKDVENEFHIRRSTASAVLKLMEKNGLVRRESVPQDARLKRLVPTDQALAIHTQLVQSLQALDDLLLRDISPADRETFFRVVEQMRQNLEAENPPQP